MTSEVAVFAGQSLYEQVSQLYADYTTVIASGDLNRWAEFFTEDCLYQATSRENIEQSLPLPLLQCEGKKMVEDRACAILNTQVFQPRRTRYYLSGIQLTNVTDDIVHARADFLVLQALLNSTPTVVSFGEYRDEIALCGNDRLLFRRKICIYDNDVVTTSLVYPL